MTKAIQKLAKAIGCTPEELEAKLDETGLNLVWDPEQGLPSGKLLAVHRTEVVSKGSDDKPIVRPWWTLKLVDKDKHTNRSTGEVFKWKT